MTKRNHKQGKLSAGERDSLLNVLELRFTKNKHRHPGLDWQSIKAKLMTQPDKLWSLHLMEATGGEPDVIGVDKKTGAYLFCDCSPETPKDRRSICYDHEALESRKEHKPADSAMGMAEDMGIEVLTEEQYRDLHKLGNFDTKTSSWLKTPAEIRKLGGAIFGDYRFGRVFIYHNGAESYYAARAFRGILRV